MRQILANISLVVTDCDEAIRYYTGFLGFELLEDTILTAEKRWVRVWPRGAGDGCALLLARAATPEQAAVVGRQSGRSSCSYTPTTLIETMRATVQRGWHSSIPRGTNPLAG